MTSFFRTLFNQHNVTFVRSLLFNIFFPLWTFFVSIICSPLLFFPAFLPMVGYIWAAGTVAGLWLFCGIRMDIRGRENLPSQGAYVLAAKHQSAWDTFIFHLLCPKPVYVLKKELTRIPFFGLYLVHMGMICIDRSGGMSSLKELIKQSNLSLKQGRPVIIFPEGTRTAAGSKGEYQPGIAAIYSQSQAPIIPVALNSGLCWGKDAFAKKPGTIVLEFLPPILPGLKRDEFMQHLETVIEEASERLI